MSETSQECSDTGAAAPAAPPPIRAELPPRLPPPAASSASGARRMPVAVCLSNERLRSALVRGLEAEGFLARACEFPETIGEEREEVGELAARFEAAVAAACPAASGGGVCCALVIECLRIAALCSVNSARCSARTRALSSCRWALLRTARPCGRG